MNTLSRPWPLLIRAIWGVVAALAALILVASIPVYLAQLGAFTEPERIRLAVAGSPSTAADSLEYWLDLVNMIAQLISTAACLALAAVIFRRKPGEPMALLVSFFLLAFGIIMTGPLQTLVEWRADWFAVVGLLEAVLFAGWAVLFYLFPDGRFAPRWSRWLALAFAPWMLVTFFFRHFLVPTSKPEPNQIAFVFVWYMVWPVTSLVAQVYRYRRVSNQVQRQQTKWVLFAFGTVVLVILSLAGPFLYSLFNRSGGLLARMPTLARFYGPLWSMLVSTVPLSMGVAILHYRLFDVDLLINRTLVYGSLTLIVVSIYVLAVGYLSELLHESGSFILSLLATGLIAVLFQPLRDRLQRAVNRLMYGERDDPYAVLSRLGQRLETTLAPEAVLPALVETIAQTLKLPYVAIALQSVNGSEPEIAAAYGLPTGSVVRLPLTYHSERVGELRIAPRAPDEAFTPAEQRLLTDIAHQAGVAAHAVRLTADLQRSRERLVTAREEERRRLRRDLHDGLGPKLAGQALILEAVREALESQPESRALVDHLIEDSQTVVTEVRQLVHGLRPPALDEFGLVGAVRSLAAQCEPGKLRVTVTAPDPMPPLPAAVEVAAYRIAQEALTNVVKHAQAKTCVVSVTVDGDSGSRGGAERGMRLEIRDDGIGLSPNRRAGVGLSSMRERAEEIGGQCGVEAVEGRGTRVVVRLPIGGST